MRGGTPLTVLRDKDANTDWTAASDGVLEDRVYFCQGKNGDVLGLVGAGGGMNEWANYDALHTPTGFPGADADSDGDCDADDATAIQALIDASSYDVRSDVDLDGDVDAADKSVAQSRSGDTLGRATLSLTGNYRGSRGQGWNSAAGPWLYGRRYHHEVGYSLGRAAAWGTPPSFTNAYLLNDPPMIGIPSGSPGESSTSPESCVFGPPPIPGGGSTGSYTDPICWREQSLGCRDFPSSGPGGSEWFFQWGEVKGGLEHGDCKEGKDCLTTIRMNIKFGISFDPSQSSPVKKDQPGLHAVLNDQWHPDSDPKASWQHNDLGDIDDCWASGFKNEEHYGSSEPLFIERACCGNGPGGGSKVVEYILTSPGEVILRPWTEGVNGETGVVNIDIAIHYYCGACWRWLQPSDRVPSVPLAGH